MTVPEESLGGGAVKEYGPIFLRRLGLRADRPVESRERAGSGLGVRRQAPVRLREASMRRWVVMAARAIGVRCSKRPGLAQ